MNTIINIIISTISIVLAIPIMPHIIEDINPKSSVFFIMKQNLTRESNTDQLVGVSYIVWFLFKECFILTLLSLM